MLLETENRIGLVDGSCIAGAIHGKMGSLKNRRRLVKIHGRIIPIKEQSAMDFQTLFDLLCNIARGQNLLPREPITQPVSINATVYYQNPRSDLDIETLCDALQQSDVIQNDNQIYEKHLIKRIDKENPRVIFTLSPYYPEA
jgi:hypothetical protein